MADDNSITATAKSNTLTLDYWTDRWTQNLSGWHESGGSKRLWNNFPTIVKDTFPTKEPKELKIFVPLCGKARDMYMFYELGFTVVGIEFATQPIKEFFEENSLPKVHEDGSVFTTSEDGRLVIGQGDLFSFKTDQSAPATQLPFAKYDIVWDRGSLEAMNENDRERYVKYMKDLLADDGVYLLNTSDYPKHEFGGPPLAINQQEIAEYYSPDFSVEALETEDRLAEDSPSRHVWIGKGITSMTTTLYKLTPV